MKIFKTIVLCVVLLLVLTSCSAEQNNSITDEKMESVINTTESFANIENPDFRKVTWGMSKDEVIAIEGEPTNEIGDSENNFYGLIYDNITVADYNATLRYYVKNDMLIEAEYSFNCDDKTDLQINTMYYDLHNEYVKKYGNPINSSFIMQNTNYKDLKEPPYIIDSDFSFGDTAMYKDEWSNVNGAGISMSLLYSVMENEKLVVFNITYEALNDDI